MRAILKNKTIELINGSIYSRMPNENIIDFIARVKKAVKDDFKEFIVFENYSDVPLETIEFHDNGFSTYYLDIMPNGIYRVSKDKHPIHFYSIYQDAKDHYDRIKNKG